MAVKEIYLTVKERVQSSDIATRMANGAFWSFTGTATAKAVVMIAGIICARILGKELYGQYGLIKATLNTFMVLGGSGLGFTATKYISEYLREQKHKIPSIYYVTNGFAAVMAVIMVLIVYLSAEFLSNRILNTPSLEGVLRLTSAILLIVIVNVAQEGVLSGFEDFKAKAISLFCGSILQALMMIIFAYVWSLNGAIMGYGLGFCIIAIFNKFFIQRNFRKHNIECRANMVKAKDFSLLYKFALPAAMSSMLIAPSFFIIRLMIKRYTDFSAMADYDVGEQWKLLILFIPTSICAIVLPILSSINKGQKQKFWKVLNVNLVINGGAATLIALIVVLFSGTITSFYGSDFKNSLPLIILSLSCIPTSMATVLGNSIASLGRMWASFTLNSVWVIIMLALAYMFLGLGWGTTGVSLAVLLSYIEHLIVQYCYLRITHRE